MSPEAVIRRLDAVCQKWWLFTLLTTTVLAGCLCFAVLLALMTVDALVRFNQIGLAVALGAWLITTLALVAVVGRRLLRNHRGLEGAARRVEAEFPELGSALINIVQLADDNRVADQAFRAAAVKDAAARVGQFPFDSAASQQSRSRRLLYCMQTPRDLAESLFLLAVLVGVAVLCQRFIPAWGSAASRLMAPWQFIPAVGKVEILKVTPGDDQVMIGDGIEVVAEINNPQNLPHSGRLLLAVEGEKESELPMAADERHTHYRLAIPTIIKPLRYRLEIGDSQTRVYTVQIRQKPAIEELAVVFHFPAYLGRGDETTLLKLPDLEAPQFTMAEMRIRSSASLSKGHVQAGADRFSGTIDDDGRTLRVKVPLLRDGPFTIHLFDDLGKCDPNPRVNQIHVLADAPPTVELLAPGRESTAAPGGVVAAAVRAGDDHGLGQVRLEMKVCNENAPAAADDRDAIVVVKTWTLNGATAAVEREKLELKADQFKPGQTVMLRGVALDRREFSGWGLDLGPQETAGPWHSVRIVAPESKSAAVMEVLDAQRNAIWKMLQQQLHARSLAAMILRAAAVPEKAAEAGKVRGQQVEIHKAAVDLVQSIRRADGAERLAVKRAMNKLAFGDMLDAVQRCEGLQRLAADDAFAQPVAELTGVQDRIVASLRKLLDATRLAEAEAASELKKRRSSELPDDARHKLEEAQKKLEEFLRQQKKLIEATESLAKKAVEDFTKEEKELMKQLAAQEDDWSRFMKELHSDMSKLPEQDMANSSLAKELVEIQTELKMAEDALLKKAADVAVPLEQLGYERAEELTTNMEKWLTDTPKRDKQSQEESLSDKDKEAPMAELPGELQDIVGQLMEQEEDLFDEMEDVSSSAADSIDKGAGWDAADGPISNMSAQGVTGNRLPSTSEIGGRSGEGRQGKSSGEFVGDEAVGKGGRKTPSRLEQDAYTKGQIKDHSKDPVGGATGGGKESGQGGAGLQGPVPGQAGHRDLKRLAGKQANLRNKAESLDLQFQVNHFHHTDLKKMIDTMSQVERDLKAGRPQNALRQRRVLADGLGNIKQYLNGEFQVRQDSTSNLPTDVQKQILGSMQDPSPQGWDEMNREYFQRLSDGPQPSAAAAPERKP